MKKVKYLIMLSGCAVIAACSQQKQDKVSDALVEVKQPVLNQMAESLIVKHRLVTNLVDPCPGEKVELCYHGQIEITSPTDVAAAGWQLNYSQVYPTYLSKSADLNLVHVNGDLHQITPAQSFKGFKAGETKVIDYWVASTLMQEFELMPNYFLTADGLKPKVIDSTRPGVDPETGLETLPYVVSFDDPIGHIRMNAKAKNELATAGYLYRENEGIDLDNDVVANRIIPTPKNVSIAESGELDLSNGINVELTNIDLASIDMALENLARNGIHQTKNGVKLSVNVNEKLGTGVGSYKLEITQDNISIVAADESGAFYGIQSLAALIMPNSAVVKLQSIEDAPRYQYRGHHVDVGRNFHGVNFIRTLIEQMAAVKLNKLHLHLAEDEAWRLEIPGLEELTELSSKRCMDLSEKSCLSPQLGGADSPHRDGYISTKEYIDIVKYADAHHIEVIPSLDMPGHSRAAVKAMEARYHKFMQKENPAEAERYLLSDLGDETKYRSIQHYSDNTINVCMESSYSFFDKVIKEIKLMHEEAGQPLELYHIGADETAGAWIESPACKVLLADKSNNIDDLKHLSANFIERVSHILNNQGIGVAGWNDGMGETHPENMPENTWSYIWASVPGGANKVISKQAGYGWNLVLSIPDVYYFDFPYQVDPKERGYKWASRQTNTRNVFNFMPDNVPVHAEFRTDTQNLPFEVNDTLQKDEQGKVVHQPLPANYKVKGIQGQLWSETVRGESQAEYMVYPRMFALAERAWHEASWEVPYDAEGKVYNQSSSVFSEELKQQRDNDWQGFANTLGQKILPKLDKAGIFYRVPTVGAAIIDGKLNVNQALPGLTIEFKQNGGNWAQFTAPVDVTGEVLVRARSADGKRAGRTLVVN